MNSKNTMKSPRIAVRAVIVYGGKLLLVNAWPNGKSDLLCAPGGGVEPGASLPDNLAREVYEETGLEVAVGAPCLVNEFHDPKSGFHQVDIFFRCTPLGDVMIDAFWQDPECVVTQHVWATEADCAGLWIKPGTLVDIAFGGENTFTYDPLEAIAW
ncbi:MAG: NUDIX hydrolase [Pseudomonadota bacterium]